MWKFRKILKECQIVITQNFRISDCRKDVQNVGLSECQTVRTKIVTESFLERMDRFFRGNFQPILCLSGGGLRFLNINGGDVGEWEHINYRPYWQFYHKRKTCFGMCTQISICVMATLPTFAGGSRLRFHVK